MFFTRKRFFVPPTISYNGISIPIKTSHKFLGLVLDSPTLTWKHHLEKVKRSCASRLNLLKVLGNSKWGCSRRALTKFYTACIRSVIDYGYPIYGSISPSNYSKLQVIQSSAIRIILGAWKNSPIADMHCELAMPMLSVHHKDVLLSHLWKLQDSPFSNPVFNKISSMYAQGVSMYAFLTYKHKVPFIKRSQDIARTLGLECSVFSPQEVVSPMAPWLKTSGRISLDILDQIGNMQSAQVRLTSFLLTLAVNYPNYMFLYTDGSKSAMEGIVTVGSAIYIPDLPLTLKWKLNPNHSVIASELFAILQALRWIIAHVTPHSNSVICSDSLSSLQLIQQSSPGSYKGLVHKIHESMMSAENSGKVIKLQWTPAHCGVMGNEKADEAAKNTANLPETPLLLDKAERRSLHRAALHSDAVRSWNFIAPHSRLGAIKDKFEKWPWAERNSRREETLLSNFRLGNPPLNRYLHQSRISPIQYCYACPGIVEDSEHFFFNCRLYRMQRIILFRSLQGINIRNPTLKILLGGGGFSPHKNKEILDLTIAYCRNTRRFKYL